VYEPQSLPKRSGTILVITAGTADLPVAEEAAVTAEVMGNPVKRLSDVGISGLHRLLAHMDMLPQPRPDCRRRHGGCAAQRGRRAGQTSGDRCPYQYRYGASFGGLAALLGMLNSCASGVTVVNIDNGFGAGYAASLMNALREEGRGAP